MDIKCSMVNEIEETEIEIVIYRYIKAFIEFRTLS